MNKKTSITALELMEELNSNAAFLQHASARQAEISKRSADMRIEQKHLIADLNSIGVSIENVWDLVNRRNNYDEAIPLLVEHVSRPYSGRTLEGIGRALAVPGASRYWSKLLEYFCQMNGTSPPEAKIGLAVALSVIVTRKTLGQLIDLLKAPKHGESRILLLSGLMRFRNAEARKALEELADDPFFSKALGKLRRRSKTA